MLDKHRNPNGTYDGIGVMSEMTGLSRAEMTALAEQVKANSARLHACRYHEFEQSPSTAPLRSLTHQRYVCKNCGGEIRYHEWRWHEDGRRPKP